ncbi:hypothetical protein [Pseudomonas matsuisoli]|uniref:Secreted protein n=1 Tax=Pseudomonas matsuisoli TaxID=1515666 RepID=A0A917PYK4_9PSED|nr:hypothetical protein [Pseudomonas matsuisoli]GGK01317.1 hypothetical protein GCM10009304_28870 [Pseudomonas matsuisoli]
MKRAAFIITAALMASPAFAEDLCAINLQQIDDATTTSAATLGDPLKQQVTDLKKEAMQAQKSGDTESCITASTQALQLLKSPAGEGSNGGGSGSGS